MNKKYIEGLKNASPEKRYKSFLNTVADRGEVWFLASDDGVVTYDFDGFINLPVWPGKEFCFGSETGDDTAVSMEVHEFLEHCRSLNENIRLMVFPTEENAYIVDSEQLVYDIQESLDEVE